MRKVLGEQKQVFAADERSAAKPSKSLPVDSKEELAHPIIYRFQRRPGI
jgi:hypothetical protein